MKNLLIVLVALLVGLGTVVVYASVSSGNSLTVTRTVGNSGEPQGCAPIQTTSKDGLSLEMSATPNPSAGTSVCLDFVLRNVSNVSTITLGTENVTITNQAGKVAFSEVFVPTGGSTLSVGQTWETTGFWDTSQSYNGVVASAGAYHLTIQVTIMNGGKTNTIASEATVTLS